MFDVDAYRAAHRPWSFTVGGRTFGAKHVSAKMVMEYEFRAADAGLLFVKNRRRGARAQVVALAWLLRRAFPWRFSYLVRGDPVRLLLGLEATARNEALKDFFASLQGETRVPRTPAPLPPQTNQTNHSTPGTSSRAPTPRRSP